MWVSWLTRLLGGQGKSAGGAARARPRPAARSLCLEALEDRMLLSGGPGLSPPSSSPGGPAPSSLTGSPGGPSSSSQQPVGVVGPLSPSDLQNLVSKALSALGLAGGPGYPTPPGGGPTLTGDLLNPNNVAALPASMQGSAVAVVPVMLAGANTAALATLTPPQGYTVTLVPAPGGNGMAFLVVTAAQPTVAASAPMPAPC
jgi:hypothetical protein